MSSDLSYAELVIQEMPRLMVDAPPRYITGALRDWLPDAFFAGHITGWTKLLAKIDLDGIPVAQVGRRLYTRSSRRLQMQLDVLFRKYDLDDSVYPDGRERYNQRTRFAERKRIAVAAGLSPNVRLPRATGNSRNAGQYLPHGASIPQNVDFLGAQLRKLAHPLHDSPIWPVLPVPAPLQRIRSSRFESSESAEVRRWIVFRSSSRTSPHLDTPLPQLIIHDAKQPIPTLSTPSHHIHHPRSTQVSHAHTVSRRIGDRLQVSTVGHWVGYGYSGGVEVCRALSRHRALGFGLGD